MYCPAPINSSSGFVHFVDDFSRFTWIYPLKQKSETIQAFMQFKNLVEVNSNLSKLVQKNKN